MSEQRVLLPGNLDDAGRQAALKRMLMQRHGRKKRGVTSGYVLDVYPDEPGWRKLKNNIDPKRRVYYAVIWWRASAA
jgi:hypothetical protein